MHVHAHNVKDNTDLCLKYNAFITDNAEHLCPTSMLCPIGLNCALSDMAVTSIFGMLLTTLYILKMELSGNMDRVLFLQALVAYWLMGSTIKALFIHSHLIECGHDFVCALVHCYTGNTDVDKSDCIALIKQINWKGNALVVMYEQLEHFYSQFSAASLLNMPMVDTFNIFIGKMPPQLSTIMLALLLSEHTVTTCSFIIDEHGTSCTCSSNSQLIMPLSCAPSML